MMSAVLIASMATACAHAPARTQAPAERSGQLAFTRPDSLADRLEGSISNAIAEPGAALVLLNAGPEGCEQLAPSGSYSLEGTRLHVFISGFSRVVICHGPSASGKSRIFAARVGDLPPGSYDVVIQFASDPPGAQPLVRSVKVP